jgi:hypothetical protein
MRRLSGPLCPVGTKQPVNGTAYVSGLPLWAKGALMAQLMQVRQVARTLGVHENAVCCEAERSDAERQGCLRGWREGWRRTVAQGACGGARRVSERARAWVWGGGAERSSCDG